MANLTPSQIAYYAQQAGFTGLGLINAVAVALAESGGSTTATHTNTAPGAYQGSVDQGLWQINNQAWPQYASGIFDPLANAQAAFAISKGGVDFTPWSTWIQGTYRQFLTQVNNVIGGLPPTGKIATGGTLPAGLGTIPLPTIAGVIPSPVTDALTTVEAALSSLASSAGTGVNSLTTAVSDLRAVADFLQTPSLWIRVVVGVLGAILLVVGLVMFAASFIPKDAMKNLPLPVPV